jgi:hypothetical protein
MGHCNHCLVEYEGKLRPKGWAKMELRDWETRGDDPIEVQRWIELGGVTDHWLGSGGSLALVLPTTQPC